MLQQKNKLNVSIDDVSPHEKSSIKVVERCFELIKIFPDIKFCGDNAAMIAWAGIRRFEKNLLDDIGISAKSRWPLDEKAPYMKGPGLKL